VSSFKLAPYLLTGSGTFEEDDMGEFPACCRPAFPMAGCWLRATSY